jgi:hypothetical protein
MQIKIPLFIQGTQSGNDDFNPGTEGLILRVFQIMNFHKTIPMQGMAEQFKSCTYIAQGQTFLFKCLFSLTASFAPDSIVLDDTTNPFLV